MSETTHDSAESHVTLYWMVGAALFALTIATVLVSKYHLPHPWNFVVGLAIAALKASLVASIFMHLKWESRFVYYVLGVTGFFAVFLFLLPILDGRWTAGRIQSRVDVAAQGPAHHAPE